MIQKKVCMVGAFAVGKTSLIRRFVHSIFSENYQTTVGVRIDRKDVKVSGREASLILWDLHGEDEFQRLRSSYLRGSAGIVLVVDGTRPETLGIATQLKARIEEQLGKIPVALLLNKSDLEEEWLLSRKVEDDLLSDHRSLIRTSARTGEGVEEAFLRLTEEMLEDGKKLGSAAVS